MADTAEDVRKMLRGLFAEGEVPGGFDVAKIDASAVRDGWNWKESGYWGYERGAIEKRAGDLRGVLFGCGEDEEVCLQDFNWFCLTVAAGVLFCLGDEDMEC